MHICFLCNEYPPGKHGGVGSFTQTLARALVSRGHEVTALGVYKATRSKVDTDCGVRVIRLARSRMPKVGFLINSLRLRQALLKIHGMSPIYAVEGPEMSLAAFPVRSPFPKIIRMNGGHHFFSITLGNKPRKARAWVEKQSFDRADGLCAVSRFVSETTREILHLGSQPIEILPNPVDTSFFSPKPEVREEEGLIIFVGTVCEKKGIRQLIQAMPQIAEAVPGAHLLVAGRDWHDPVTGASFTESLQSSLPPALVSRVNFIGAVEHSALPDLLARSQVCAFPSHMEAQGIVIVEGMSMGKAVVATNTGPGPELIQNNYSGLLCDPYNPASIAEKIVRLLKDPTLRTDLGMRARRCALEQFSVDVLVSRNEEFYRRCVDRSGNNAA